MLPVYRVACALSGASSLRKRSCLQYAAFVVIMISLEIVIDICSFAGVL